MRLQGGILCIGEILWDSLPSGLYLGGAPLNVCYHLNQLGIKASIASKVGEDRLGKEAISRINAKGISTDLIQKDGAHETGFVCVDISNDGDPKYRIVESVAWDFIRLNNPLTNATEDCWGLVFGTLAQRNEASRETIQQLWKLDMLKILDMNLRRPYVDKDIIYDSLEVADIIKMNEEELNQLKDWYDLSGGMKKTVEHVAEKFNCSLVCITQGANGAMIYRDDIWTEHNGFPKKAKDVVGAGDAFLAALIFGIKNGKVGNELLAYANATGALVAQKDGATPSYSMEDILSQMEESS
ncbi:MAG: carbohydrate kinase [Balneolaceae bacterium]|nr:carbohydrate kinase [Balneolaceae bacterium]